MDLVCSNSGCVSCPIERVGSAVDGRSARLVPNDCQTVAVRTTCWSSVLEPFTPNVYARHRSHGTDSGWLDDTALINPKIVEAVGAPEATPDVRLDGQRVLSGQESELRRGTIQDICSQDTAG